MQFPVSHPDDGLIDISIQEVVRLVPTTLSRFSKIGILGQ